MFGILVCVWRGKVGGRERKRERERERESHAGLKLTLLHVYIMTTYLENEGKISTMVFLLSLSWSTQ